MPSHHFSDITLILHCSQLNQHYVWFKTNWKYVKEKFLEENNGPDGLRSRGSRNSLANLDFCLSLYRKNRHAISDINYRLKYYQYVIIYTYRSFSYQVNLSSLFVTFGKIIIKKIEYGLYSCPTALPNRIFQNHLTIKLTRVRSY